MRLRPSLGLFAFLALAGCGSVEIVETTSTGAGGQGGQGGQGGASTSSSTGTSSTGGGGAGGSGGAAPCLVDDDCKNDPGGPVCDPATGACVGCLPGGAPCPANTYCDPASKQCTPGCDDDTDCAANPDGKTLCDPLTHECSACVVDTDCPLGQICFSKEHSCVPGCSVIQACAAGLSCCIDSFCADLENDIKNCGSCLNDCLSPNNGPPPNAEVFCKAGQCGMGACKPGWADCNGQPQDGCEWNTLQDGPCVCAPGMTQACYTGQPGTQGVGVCKGGIKTCNPGGTAWGPCTNQVLPTSELCQNGVDEDCNGKVDDVPDADGDGWTTCNGDCCDLPGACGKTPNQINPGAFEVLGNGIDDDCDPTTPDDAPPTSCSLKASFAGVTATDIAKAMDLCQTTTAAPPLPQKRWGLLSADYRLPDGTVPSPAQLADIQNWQTAILMDYGTGGIVPKNGATLAGLSTGRMRDQSDPGFVNPYPGTSFGVNAQPPMSYLAAHGGKLPSTQGCMGNCPAGSGAFDPVGVRLSIRVPTNAVGFAYDFRYNSAEYWQFTCSSRNDFFLALYTSQQVMSLPADKNIAFDSVGSAVSVNNAFFEVCVPKNDGPNLTCNTCPLGPAPFAGTGMQLNNTGGGTSWLTTEAPVVPGETITLDLMVFDVFDGTGDSNVLLDNFRWAPPCPGPCPHP